jgi:hypothetical protein
MTHFYLRVGVAMAIAGTTGCVTLPEPALSSRPAASVAASVGRTWDAAIDQLADRGLAVRSIERDSGFIATQTIALPPFSTDAARWADCGTFATFRFAPNAVDYTIFVRGNATGATVKTSARHLVKPAGEAPTDCVSTGAFEQSFDAAVKQRAEELP